MSQRNGALGLEQHRSRSYSAKYAVAGPRTCHKDHRACLFGKKPQVFHLLLHCHICIFCLKDYGCQKTTNRTNLSAEALQVCVWRGKGHCFRLTSILQQQIEPWDRQELKHLAGARITAANSTTKWWAVAWRQELRTSNLSNCLSTAVCKYFSTADES